MCQTKFVKLKLENLLIEVFFLGFDLPPWTNLLNLIGQQHLRLLIGGYYITELTFILTKDS